MTAAIDVPEVGIQNNEAFWAQVPGGAPDVGAPAKPARRRRRAPRPVAPPTAAPREQLASLKQRAESAASFAEVGDVIAEEDTIVEAAIDRHARELRAFAEKTGDAALVASMLSAVNAIATTLPAIVERRDLYGLLGIARELMEREGSVDRRSRFAWHGMLRELEREAAKNETESGDLVFAIVLAIRTDVRGYSDAIGSYARTVLHRDAKFDHRGDSDVEAGPQAAVDLLAWNSWSGRTPERVAEVRDAA